MVALRTKFANQNFPARSSRLARVQLEAETSRIEPPDTNFGIAQMRKQRNLNILPHTDVDPLATVEDSIDSAGRRRVSPN